MAKPMGQVAVLLFVFLFNDIRTEFLDKLSSPPYKIVCDQPLPRKCLKDMKANCLVGKDSPVYGHCALQTAICDYNEKYDFAGRCLLKDSLP